MSPYELLDLSQSNFSNSTALIAVFLSLSFAYLAAAYFVGSDLTRDTSLYIKYALCSFRWNNCIFRNRILKRSHSCDDSLGDSLTQTASSQEDRGCRSSSGFCLLVAIFMCLKFMWDVRRPK